MVYCNPHIIGYDFIPCTLNNLFSLLIWCTFELCFIFCWKVPSKGAFPNPAGNEQEDLCQDAILKVRSISKGGICDRSLEGIFIIKKHISHTNQHEKRVVLFQHCTSEKLPFTETVFPYLLHIHRTSSCKCLTKSVATVLPLLQKVFWFTPMREKTHRSLG